jgi:hypothetical protein
VDQLGQQLADILSRIQEIAPSVYAAARAQVIIDAQMNFYWLWALGVVGVLLLISTLVALFKRRNLIYDSHDTAAFFLFSCFIVDLIFFVGIWIDNTKVLRNPDWYAIQLLISQFKK